MKAAIIILAAAALPAMAGQPANIATTPWEVSPGPLVASPITVELGAGYNYAVHKAMEMGTPNARVNTYNVDLTSVYHLDDHNALTMRLGYATGSGRETADYTGEGDLLRNRIRSNSFSLMPGYRYTQPINDKLSAFAGANIGIGNTSLKYKDSNDLSLYKSHDSDWGFVYSAEAGIRYALNTNLDIFAAYQFSGSTAQPEIDRVNSRKQISHGLRIGVGMKF